MTVEHGATDQFVTVIAEDAAGARVLSRDESHFTIHYRRGVNGAMVPVTAVSLAAITTAHTDGGVKALGNTEAPGAVRVDLPDAIFAAGVNSATVHFVIAGARPQDVQFELTPPVTITAGRVSSKVEVIDNDAITNAAIQDNALSAGKIASAAITAAKFAAGAIDAAAIATDAIGSAEIAASAVTKIQAGLATATAVDDVETLVATRLAAASYTTPPTAAAIADQVWEETLADHSGTAGSTAAALNAAGSAGDPWNTALPGAYGAGSAGKIIGDNLNATVSSRATPAQVGAELVTYDAPTKAELDSAVAPLATAAGVPSASTNASAVRTELGVELARVDAAVSTRATPAQVNTETDTALSDVGLTPTITGRIDAAVSTRLATAGYTAPPTAVQNADALIARNEAGGSNSGRTIGQAIARLRNRVAVSGDTLTVYAEDDTTPLWTATITTSPGDPVSDVNPI